MRGEMPAPGMAPRHRTEKEISGMTDIVNEAAVPERDDLCTAPGCELWMSEHSPEQARACEIAGLEQYIAKIERRWDGKRTALVESGAFWGQGQLDGTDRDPLQELDFEYGMEVVHAREKLERLLNGEQAAQQPAAEMEAER
jgi:hypothetical protein